MEPKQPPLAPQSVWIEESERPGELQAWVNDKLSAIEATGGAVLDVQYAIGSSTNPGYETIIEARHGVMIRYRTAS